MKNSIELIYIVREIEILHQLSQMENNIFTTKLVDILIEKEQKDPAFRHIFLVMDFCDSDLQQIIQNDAMDLSEQHVITIAYNIL